MIRSLLLAAAACVAIPASAATYDAFSSFNGTQGAGNFYYGEANPANAATGGTFFQTSNTNCFISNAQCLQRAPNFDVPGFAKGGSPAFQYNSVNVPQDRLLGHPANDDNQTFIAFVAPTAGVYKFFARFNVQDVRPSGLNVNLITTTNGSTPLVFAPIGQVNGLNTVLTYAATFNLGASEAVGFGLDRAGFYGNDSTGVQLRVADVPEPAAWAMMIGGFGMIGFGSRRRRSGMKAVSA